MDLDKNHDDAMEMGSSEENITLNIRQVLKLKAEFDDLWPVLDTLTTFIEADKKKNYSNLKDIFTNIVKYAEEFPKISGL